jgi:cytochrome c oxidase subunit 2
VTGGASFLLATGLALALLTTACGGGGDAPLPPAAASGRQIARDAGCTSCHGSNGQGGVGPSWTGLAGSTVNLADGSEVVADQAYLERAIREPGAQAVAGYTIAMPTNKLTPAEVDDVIAYIEALK